MRRRGTRLLSWSCSLYTWPLAQLFSHVRPSFLPKFEVVPPPGPGGLLPLLTKPWLCLCPLCWYPVSTCILLLVWSFVIQSSADGATREPTSLLCREANKKQSTSHRRRVCGMRIKLHQTSCHSNQYVFLPWTSNWRNGAKSLKGSHFRHPQVQLSEPFKWFSLF